MSPAVSITQRTLKSFSLSVQASFFSAKKHSVTLSAPVAAWIARVRRSLSGMVSSTVGASMDTVTEERLLPKAMPAASIWALVRLKISSSSGEEMSATFMRLR